MHFDAGWEFRFEKAYATTADHIAALGMAGTGSKAGKQK